MTEVAVVSSSDLVRLRSLLTATGPAMELRSPLTGGVVGELPTSTAADVEVGAQLAHRAQAEWAARPIAERAGLLLDFHDQLLDQRDYFLDLLQSVGKDRLSAVNEVLHVALTARYYGRTARRYLRSERGQGVLPLLTRVDRHYVPKGLVGVIGPWNYPLTMAISDGLAALVAGNAIMLKPDHQTPQVALAAVELLRSSGLPPDLWQVVHGRGTVVGRELIDVSDYVCFTGSTATGRTVAAQCAHRLIGCSLELGGKNPMVILDDADVEATADGAVRASFSSAGQLCVSTERIYVAEPLFEPFTRAFVARTKALRLGYAPDFEHDIGCLINHDQLEQVSAHVEDAKTKGATVLTGGRRREDVGELFYEPTILTGVTPEMECYAEETFGPVVSIYPVLDDDEAVARANESDYGLNASVWTSDHERGRRVASKIKCGAVNVNEGFAATFGSIDAPMGGMKNSGLGRRQGRDGIRRFVDVQSVATQTGIPLAPSRGLDGKSFTSLMTGALRIMKKAGRA
ncbi:MAG TPA: succinic semialdehyde dehydrogenase [Propionibacteriaceae bacterium]|nr:succinic semialdehyde dehydrogenase [Propionibacteriaceae bacterium]